MKENNPPQIDCRIEHCTRPPKYDLNDNSFEQHTYLPILQIGTFGWRVGGQIIDQDLG